MLSETLKLGVILGLISMIIAAFVPGLGLALGLVLFGFALTFLCTCSLTLSWVYQQCSWGMPVVVFMEHLHYKLQEASGMYTLDTSLLDQ